MMEDLILWLVSEVRKAEDLNTSSASASNLFQYAQSLDRVLDWIGEHRRA